METIKLFTKSLITDYIKYLFDKYLEYKYKRELKIRAKINREALDRLNSLKK